MHGLRIGLTQRVDVCPGYGERRDCLDQAWARLVGELGFTPVPLANCVEDVGQYVNAIGLTGVILTGGNDLENTPGGTNFAPERDCFERGLIDFCSTKKLPVFGVCRGLQMLVVCHGGQLTPVERHVATSHSVKRCRKALPPYFGSLDRVKVNSFHNFGVMPTDLGNGMQAIAKAPDGTVEAIVHASLRQAAVMWHPERDPYDGCDAELIRLFFQEAVT